MNIRILLPTEVLLDREVDQIAIVADDGARGLLPHHTDYVTSLQPGIMTLSWDGLEEFVAVDGGILVKRGSNVDVSTRNAVFGTDLAQMQQIVAEQFLHEDEREKKLRSTMARLESDFVQRMVTLEDRV